MVGNYGCIGIGRWWLFCYKVVNCSLCWFVERFVRGKYWFGYVFMMGVFLFVGVFDVLLLYLFVDVGFVDCCIVGLGVEFG